MGPDAGRATRVPGGLSALAAAAATGLAYALVELLWQRFVSPTPTGLPGSNGPGLLALVGLGLTVFGWPALLTDFLLPWRGRPGRDALVLVAAILPTASVVLDRRAEIHGWSWIGAEAGGVEHALRLGAASLAVAVVGALVLDGLRRRAALPSLRWPATVAVVLAPLLFWMVRTEPPQTLPAGAAPEGAPNVVLLTVDTLRQDALGAYGGPPTATLDSLLLQGTRFDGWSVSSWTRPSMAAFFSGVAPAGNGAEVERAVQPGVAWWIEDLQRQGWATAAVASNPHLRSRFGFGRGFGYYEHSDHVEWLEPVIRSYWGVWLQRQLVDRRDTDRADRVVERTRHWLHDRRPADRPWVLWVHFMDPHLPYHLRGENGELEAEEVPAWVGDLGRSFEGGLFRDLPGVRAGRVAQSEAARKALRRLYRREVLFLDRQLGRLLPELRAASADRPLVWVVASDHGEEFWDDGGFEHGHKLHSSVLQVPLAMGGIPMFAAHRYAGPLRLSDVGPTLLAALGVEGYDPRKGAGADELEEPLLPYVLGQDRSRALGAVDPDSCRWPALVAEGIFYGPPQTRILDPEGRSLHRADSTGVITVKELCAAGSGERVVEPQALPDRDRAWLWNIDLWRQRTATRSRVVEDDPELDRRLRSLGYAQ